MRVIKVREYGGPEVLKIEEAETPQAGAGQVVIKVAVAGVSFGNTIVRSGKYNFPLPFVPGWEVGGEVSAIGEGVDRGWLGQRVVANTNNNSGGYAEQVAVDLATVYEVPANLPLEQAVRVFLAGQTALAILDTVTIRPDDTVLVTSAAGGTGSLMVQLVKMAGAKRVVGAVGSPEKEAVLAALGLDVTVDYSRADWPETVKALTNGQGVDVVIDTVGGDICQQAYGLLANGRGRLVVYGTTAGDGFTLDTREVAQRGLTVIGALGTAVLKPAAEMRGFAELALAEAAAERLIPLDGPVFPLEEAPAAHAALESRQAFGKILLIP